MISQVQNLYSEACAQVSNFVERRPKTAKAGATALAVLGLALTYYLCLRPSSLKEIFRAGKVKKSSVEYICRGQGPISHLWSNYYCREKLTLVSDSHKMVCLLPPQAEDNVKTLFRDFDGYVSERFISLMKAQENPQFCNLLKL